MTPEQEQEVERATLLFSVALAGLGTQAVSDSLSLWEGVPPLPGQRTSQASAKWLTLATAYVVARRVMARDLAFAYYRYERALATGKTIALPGQENPPTLSLFALKAAFEGLLSGSLPESQVDDEEERTWQIPSPAGLEDAEIEVEEIDGLEEEFGLLEEDAEQQALNNLYVLGPQNLDGKINKIAPINADQVDADREGAHKAAGNRQAAETERNVLNGARGSLFLVSDRDRRVLGWARHSSTGTPCGFCAMLISRGFVMRNGKVSGGLYSSNQGTSADTTYGDLDLYHANCHCFAVPVFSVQQMRSDAVFALNREYAELWPTVTKGLSGKEALSAWRAFIRKAKSQKSQVAATDGETNTQEVTSGAA